MSDEQDKVDEVMERLSERIATRLWGAPVGGGIKFAFQPAVAAELAQVEELIRDIARIANELQLPDGDGVNVPTGLWAEDWLRRL